MSNLLIRNPICFFDLETTGINTVHDRIIEIAIIKLFPNDEIQRKHHRINPERPIPAELSKIHHITDADVKDCPTFKEVAKEYAKFMEGADLGGFNILQFDLPLLIEEFLRAGVEFDYERKKIIDAQKIFYLMEKRTLSAAYQFYCQKELKGAHSALHDAEATLEVLQAQIARYENQPVTDGLGNLIGTLTADIQELSRLTSESRVDLAGRMKKNERGDVIFNFGKHKNKLVKDVLKSEPSYYDWMMTGDFAMDTKRKLTQLKLSFSQAN